MANPPPPTPAPASDQVTLAEFLETSPPNQWVKIPKLYTKKTYGPGYQPDFMVTLPDIQLHCSQGACNGTRFFRSVTKSPFELKNPENLVFLTYLCSNCQENQKIFAVCIAMESSSILKLGEIPTFGPPTPARLISLIGPDRDSFLKGRQCENQGLGIGAFIYYRRVVENQKDRILREIKRVSEKVGMKPERLAHFDEALDEQQFSKSIDLVKDAIPETILIDGHNPLKLLHSALSKGVHELSDADCLALAQSIRVVLAELSDRLATALKDEHELKQAVSALLNSEK